MGKGPGVFVGTSMWEAKVGGSLEPGIQDQPRQHSETQPQKTNKIKSKGFE